MPPRQASTPRRIVRALGPAISAVPARGALRAGLGATVGLGAAGLFVLSPAVDPHLGLYLIAPFGATSVLIFAAPNSPLAQPWSVMVGNVLGAVVGVAACFLIADPASRIALAVGLTMVAMGLARAIHPSGGAVVMTAAMSPDEIQGLGFHFALMPVALGTALMVLIAARVRGRRPPRAPSIPRRDHRPRRPIRPALLLEGAALECGVEVS